MRIVHFSYTFSIDGGGLRSETGYKKAESANEIIAWLVRMENNGKFLFLSVTDLGDEKTVNRKVRRQAKPL